jgi:hypothetical protein
MKKMLMFQSIRGNAASVAAAPFYLPEIVRGGGGGAAPVAGGAAAAPDMPWGNPTWDVLHTMAEKIKPELFAQVRTDVLNVIFTICTNLPCPDCSEHAKKHLDSIGFKNIRTPEELKTAIFQFHNYVNSRKKYPIFSRDNLDEKYARVNTKKAIYYFIQHFQEGSKNPGMISQELFRTRILGQLVEWFKTNMGLFN